jgi:aspartate aminotransferase
MSFFANITQLPPDPLFDLKARYTEDLRQDKVDLGIGAYRDDNGKPWILPAVKLAEAKLVASPGYNHEYLGISGFAPFTTNAAKVILGDDFDTSSPHLVSQQSLSGTGALHVAGVFLKKFLTAGPGSSTIYLSSPTWGNHKQIFTDIGFDVKQYPYWNNDTKSLDFDGFINTIKNAPRGSIFLLHACAHNPTGLDPTEGQWKTLIDTINEHKHVALFDSAYQGFASGDLRKDSFSIRYAVSVQKDVPIIICQSFAKNVGMYGERVGVIHVLHNNAVVNKAIKSQLNKIIRSEISNPPAYGAKIVATILSDPQLYAQWRKDLVTMSSRINQMRRKLRDHLNQLGTPGTWDHIVGQTGMFSFTGLTAKQVQRLEKSHGVYMVSSGRASIAGLNEGNVERVAKAIDEVVRFEKPSL